MFIYFLYHIVAQFRFSDTNASFFFLFCSFVSFVSFILLSCYVLFFPFFCFFFFVYLFRYLFFLFSFSLGLSALLVLRSANKVTLFFSLVCLLVAPLRFILFLTLSFYLSLALSVLQSRYVFFIYYS